MRSLFKLSLAALVACLFAAGSAMAVDVKMSGNIGTAFGLASFGETATVDATSAYATSYEANLRTTIGGGPLTQVFRFRPRGSNYGAGAAVTSGDWAVGDLYAETYWRPVDNLTILMGRQQGGAWSSPLAGAYLIHNAVAVTHQEYWMNWTGVDGLDIEYNLGTMQVGLGLAGECKPSCGTGTRSTQSMTPHFMGKFGDISVRAQLPSTSSKTVADVAQGGSGMQAGVAWSGGGGLMVAFDIQSFTDAAFADKEDYTKTGTNIRLDIAGITISLWNGALVNAGGTDGNDSTISTMLVRYTMKVGDGAIYPEYGSITTTPDGGDAITNTLLRLVGNMGF